MAGWGTGSFENEEAHRFLGRLNSLGIDELRAILARVAGTDDYLEAPESAIAIAAAEVVAALVGNVGDGALPAGPRAVADWTSQHIGGASPDLAELARQAVTKARTNSELKDLWLQAEGLNEWNASLRDLHERLSR